MKLCRYGKAGYEKPGMIDQDGRLRRAQAQKHVAGQCDVRDTAERAMQVVTCGWRSGDGLEIAGAAGVCKLSVAESREISVIDRRRQHTSERILGGNTDPKA